MSPLDIERLATTAMRLKDELTQLYDAMDRAQLFFWPVPEQLLPWIAALESCVKRADSLCLGLDDAIAEQSRGSHAEATAEAPRQSGGRA